MSKELFRNTIAELVEKFDRNIDVYKKQSSSFNETQLRIEFLDPMFEALGWDMNNKAGSAEQYKEVIHEDRVYIEGKPKAPDYSFKFWGERKFFLEAKQPFVNIKSDYKPALQLRRYAWSAHLPVSILSDFEEFAIYDTTIEPKATDKASVARLTYYKYTDYLEKWEEIYDTFAKESIQQGSFDKYIAKEKRGSQLVDKVFLKEIESWREWLAKDIAKNNSDISVADLNFAVQKIIDRIIFLRIAEDRGIEPYKTLENIIKSKNSYKELVKHFKVSQTKYNSGLFNFEEDTITQDLKISDILLDKILGHLYYPKSPYEFSVIGVELLGSIYEQFLGKVIRLTKGHNAKVEEKPEVKKAGGVYYTPRYIVEYIVKNTVGELLKGKTPKQAEKIKVLDPACGSGSFLIGAYEYILDWYLAEYIKLSDAKKKSLEKKGVIYQTVSFSSLQRESSSPSVESWNLTTKEKKRIMTNNIYGVDIDSQAVEVTKLSLALKMLENENQETINQQMKLFAERILPDLSRNIKCGNSLVGSDYWDDKDLAEVSEEEINKVNAFDWEQAFSFAFKEKELQAYMLTWVTHNSRISERMVKFGVKIGDPVRLNEKSRKIIASALSEKIKSAGYKVIATNVLSDHVHCVVVCTKDEISDITQNLKGYSSHTHNRLLQLSDSGKGKQTKLWAKGSSKTHLKTDEHLANAISYVKNNHEKHEVSKSCSSLYHSQLKQVVVDKHQAFTPVYEGGFDAVIGNPPYVRHELITEYKPYFEKKYTTYAGTADLYTYFIENGVNMIKEDGFYSIIVANKWMRAKYGQPLRGFLQQKNIQEIIDFGDLPVFQNATTYPCILTVQGGKANKEFSVVNVKTLDFELLEKYVQKSKMKVDQIRLDPSGWSLVDKRTQNLLDKLNNTGTPLGEYVDGKIYRGVLTGLNEAFVIDEETKDRLIKEDPKSVDVIKPFLAGRDIKRYMPVEPNKYLLFIPWHFPLHKDENIQGVSKKAEKEFEKQYPAIYNYLLLYKNKLSKRNKAETGIRYEWYALQRYASSYYEEFEKEKIVYQVFQVKPVFTFDRDASYTNNAVWIIPESSFQLLGMLNSKLGWFLISNYCTQIQNGYQLIFKYLGKIPIVKGSSKLGSLVEKQLTFHKQLSKVTGEQKKKMIQQQIDRVDEEINQEVYGLYGLTGEEIDIIEGGIK